MACTYCPAHLTQTLNNLNNYHLIYCQIHFRLWNQKIQQHIICRAPGWFNAFWMNDFYTLLISSGLSKCQLLATLYFWIFFSILPFCPLILTSPMLPSDKYQGSEPSFTLNRLHVWCHLYFFLKQPKLSVLACFPSVALVRCIWYDLQHVSASAIICNKQEMGFWRYCTKASKHFVDQIFVTNLSSSNTSRMLSLLVPLHIS